MQANDTDILPRAVSSGSILPRLCFTIRFITNNSGAGRRWGDQGYAAQTAAETRRTGHVADRKRDPAGAVQGEYDLESQADASSRRKPRRGMCSKCRVARTRRRRRRRRHRRPAACAVQEIGEVRARAVGERKHCVGWGAWREYALSF